MRNNGYISVFNLIIGNIRTVEMFPNRVDDQAKKLISIRFRKKSLRYVEERAQRLHARGIAFALIIR